MKTDLDFLVEVKQELAASSQGAGEGRQAGRAREAVLRPVGKGELPIQAISFISLAFPRSMSMLKCGSRIQNFIFHLKQKRLSLL